MQGIPPKSLYRNSRFSFLVQVTPLIQSDWSGGELGLLGDVNGNPQE